MIRAASRLHLEHATRRREQDVSAFRAGQIDGEVQHQRQHLIYESGAANRTNRVQQIPDLSEIVDDCGMAAQFHAVFAGHKRQEYAAALAQLNAISVLQPLLLDALAVQEGAEPRSAVS